MRDAVRSARSNETLSIGLVVLIVVAWGALSIGSASGSCVGPSLRLDVPGSRVVPVVRAGSTTAVVGSNWFSQCNDTPGPCQRAGTSGPIDGVSVTIVRARGRGADLSGWRALGPVGSAGTRDAAGDGSFRIDGVTIPSEPGKYLLVGSAPEPPGFADVPSGGFVVKGRASAAGS